MKIKNISFIILLLITSFLIGVIFIPKANASSSDILRYDFEKDSLVDISNKDNVNLRHNNVITDDYNGTYSFTNDGTYSAVNWSFGQDGGSVIVNSICFKHRKVLNLIDINSSSVNAHTSFDDQLGNPTIEFWMLTNDTSKYSWISIRDDEIHIYFIGFIDSCIKYNDGGWHTIIDNAENDYWYHIRMTLDTSNNQFDLWLDNIKKVNDGGTMNNIIDGIDDVMVSTDSTTADYIVFYDAFGFSWKSPYYIGLNKYPITEKSQLLSSDKYEFNLNDDGNPYDQIGFPDVDFWNRYSQYNFDVYPDTPDFTAKTKNINGIKILSSQDGSGTGIRNQSLGLTRDKFNITFGFQITNMDEINSYTTFTIYSLNDTEIIKLKFDTQTNQDTNLQYYDGSSYQDLVSIHGLDPTRVLEFNLYIYNFSVNLSWYRTDDWTTTYSFPLISNLWGINQIHFYNYDPTSDTDYYHLRLNYIGIYQYNVSMCREYGYLDYELIDDWNLNYHNVLSVNVYNQTIKIIAFGKIEGLYSNEIFNEFDNNSFCYNFHDDERIIENAHLFLIIQSNFNLSKSLYLLIERVKLSQYIDDVFDREGIINYYYYNLNNQSYYYVDDSNRLCYHFDITQNDTSEYMILYFDFDPGISSNYMNIYFKCRELSFSIGDAYIDMTYYQPPDNRFYLKTYETTINTLLERGKEFRRFHFVIWDKNNNNYTNYIGEGYLYGLQFIYMRYGIPGKIDIITFSLLAIIIPLIIIITPTIGIYSIYKKKEIVIPMMLLMSIICFATSLIPFELFFIMLLCYGCGIFIQYKKGFD